MARTGQFGRLPKAAPDLSGTIVALMREYAAQVDQNMVDAWKNGGRVDGKPVTDARLLAHLKMRRNELDKSDPKWAEWDNRVLQYTFAIDESKMRVKWDNKQASEADMAAFYRKWEQRTPDNTEFDRSLRSSFGQWANAAAARGRASAAASARKAHDAKVKGIYDSQVKVGESLNSALVWMAKQIGIIPPGDSASLTDTLISQDDISQLLDIVQDGKATDPKFQPTVDQVTAYMKGIDKNFKWGPDYVNTKIGQAQSGYDLLIKGARTKTEARQWASRKTDVTITNNRVQALSPMSSYIAARELWEQRMSDSSNDPAAQREITKEYLKSISGIYTQITSGGSLKGTSKTDEALAGPLAQEVDYLTRGVNGEKLTGVMPPTLFDNSTGTTAESGQDASSWTGILNAMNENYEKVKNGGWAEPVTNPADGKTIYKWHGPEEQPRFDMAAVPGTLTIDGKPITVFVAPTPVPVVTIGPNGQPTNAASIRTNPEGKPVDAQGNLTNDPKQAVVQSNIGFSTLTFPGPSGDPITIYQSQAANGAMVYTTEPPIIPNSGAEVRSDGKGGIVVSIKQTPDPVTGAAAPFDSRKYNSVQVLPLEADGSVNVDRLPAGFTTKTGAMFYAALSSLDPDDKAYEQKRDALFTQGQNASTLLQQQANELRANGLGGEADSLYRDAASIGRDVGKARLLVAMQESDGDPGKLLASIFANPNDGSGRTPRAVTDAFTDPTKQRDLQQQMQARQWLTSQINDAERRFNLQGAGSISTEDGVPTEGFEDLRSKVGAATDPRTLKLPSWVTGGANNPFTSGAPLQLPNAGNATPQSVKDTPTGVPVGGVRPPAPFSTGLPKPGQGVPVPGGLAGPGVSPPPKPPSVSPPPPVMPGKEEDDLALPTAPSLPGQQSFKQKSGMTAL